MSVEESSSVKVISQSARELAAEFDFESLCRFSLDAVLTFLASLNSALLPLPLPLSWILRFNTLLNLFLFAVCVSLGMAAEPGTPATFNFLEEITLTAGDLEGL